MAYPVQHIFSTEVVWDSGQSGTAIAEDGASLEVGPTSAWPPEHLLALSAASCFMRTFLRLAVEHGLEVLGYVSSGTVDLSSDPTEIPSLNLAPCIVIGSDDDLDSASHLCQRALQSSPVCRALESRVRLAATIKVIPKTEEAC